MFTLLRLNGSCSGLTMIRGVSVYRINQRAYTRQSGILPKHWTIQWMNLLNKSFLWTDSNDLVLSNEQSFSDLSVAPQGCVLSPSPHNHWLFQPVVSGVSACSDMLQTLVSRQHSCVDRIRAFNQYPTTVWLHFESNTDWVKKQSQRRLFLSRKIC